MEVASCKIKSLTLFTEIIFDLKNNTKKKYGCRVYAHSVSAPPFAGLRSSVIHNSFPTSLLFILASFSGSNEYQTPTRSCDESQEARRRSLHTLSSEQDPDSDSDATSARRSAPRPNLVQSDDSVDSDSDAFVDDSESDCPRPRKAALGKKRKRSKSPVLDQGERRNLKVEKVEMEDRKAKEVATGFMVKSGNVVKNILLGKAGQASRESLAGPAERVYGERQHRGIRRAGLSDMGPVIGSYTCGWRDEVWTKAAEVFVLESRKGVAKGPVDSSGYRASRFSEHL